MSSGAYHCAACLCQRQPPLGVRRTSLVEEKKGGRLNPSPAPEGTAGHDHHKLRVINHLSANDLAGRRKWWPPQHTQPRRPPLFFNRPGSQEATGHSYQGEGEWIGYPCGATRPHANVVEGEPDCRVQDC